MTIAQQGARSEVEAGTSATEDRVKAFIAADYRGVVRALTPVAASPEAAEDAVAEALARLWERADHGEEIASTRAWVLVVAMNVLRGRGRRAVVAQRYLRRFGRRGDEAAEPATVSVDLRRALAELPSRQRELVVLHYLADLPVAEIADQLDVSVGTVKAGLNHARAALAASPMLQRATPVEDGTHDPRT